ncbi:hypothetical protein [Taibaiella soli]|uniref:Uncharacterized protein n=1 Tax=Taibaiella soli TaxID=1649169 RepID=A0A2W2BLS1_9BACT|nr:hypothetical protein [Taibaiella soli]PZF74386.1 hypothetical protein DN068_02060 [Taibaiella soli]
MTQHGAYSIVVDIKSGMQQPLYDLLQKIDDSGVEDNDIIPFKKITTIHFARFVILDACKDAYGKDIPAQLAFTTNYDLPLNNHMQQMISVAGRGLWQIFSMCEKFPQGAYNASMLELYLQNQSLEADTFYVGVGYRSVQQIHEEHVLRNAINDFADRNRQSIQQQPANTTRQQIIDYVHSNADLAFARTPVPNASEKWNVSFYGKLIGLAILFIVLLPIIIPFVIVWMLIVLSIEIREKQVPNDLTKDHIRELVNRETQLVQAQFSALGNVKPGKVRLATMMFLLRMTNFLAPYLFSKGKLSGIPTVHFARWLIINEGRQMLFLSNYDGNSENYLRDFIHIAAKQLTLMFCHTEGYPKTRLMMFGGAKDAEGFMEWARAKQIITNVWYSANKEVSVDNVYSNSKIRNGLYGTMSETEASEWLRSI